VAKDVRPAKIRRLGVIASRVKPIFVRYHVARQTIELRPSHSRQPVFLDLAMVWDAVQAGHVTAFVPVSRTELQPDPRQCVLFPESTTNPKK